MGRATSKCNEAKSKMKHVSEIAQSGFEPRCYRSVMKLHYKLGHGGAVSGNIISLTMIE